MILLILLLIKILPLINSQNLPNENEKQMLLSYDQDIKRDTVMNFIKFIKYLCFVFSG